MFYFLKITFEVVQGPSLRTHGIFPVLLSAYGDTFIIYPST